MPALQKTCPAVKSPRAQIWCQHQPLLRRQSLALPQSDGKLMEHPCLGPSPELRVAKTRHPMVAPAPVHFTVPKELSSQQQLLPQEQRGEDFHRA